MKDSTVTLREFIDAAQRSRKYPENTAMALKSALRLFETELNEEEKGSVDVLKKNLERIYQAVFDKNKTKYSSGSLDTYRKRISKLLNDYMNYGTDPAKMNNWSPPIKKVTSTKRGQQKKDKPMSDSERRNGVPNENHPDTPGARLDWPLANGRKAILILPHDLTFDEAEIIKQLVGLRVDKPSDDTPPKN